MRHIVLIPALLVFGAFVIAGCKSGEKQTSAVSPQWFSNMHRLSVAHLKLMPVVNNAKEFADPARQPEIRRELDEMVAAATGIARDKDAPDADPLIKFSALRFTGEVKQAKQAYDMGDLQWARYSLNRASGYCISCHTRADRGAKDFDMAWSPQLQSLTLSERVEYLLANRRYTSALEEAKKLAADIRQPQVAPYLWALAIQRTMAMVVRVRKDPVEAEKLALAVAENRSAPLYARSDATAWLRDIRQWRKESATAKSQSKDAGYKTAVALMKAVHPGRAPRGRAALIANLRASNLLHEELEKSKSPNYSEALLYAGLVAQSLGEVNQGFLDQYYFERCIRSSPHTELSGQCYFHLERAVQASNPFLEMEPEIEWYRLNELRKLSEIR